MKNVLVGTLISLTTLLMLFCGFEILARTVLPPQTIVQVNTSPRETAKGDRRALRADDGHLDTLMDWSGHHGVRLHPNVSATIVNHTLSRRDVLIETNSFGLRGLELGPKQPNEYRILVMGDSITFGDYVSAEETITAHLETLLNIDPGSGKRFIVINGGLPGANGSDEYYHYLEIKDAVDADIVLVGMYLNDANNSKDFYAKRLIFPFDRSRFLSWGATRLAMLDQRYFKISETPDVVGEEWREEFRAGRHLQTGDMRRDPAAFDYEIYNAALDFGLGWNIKAWESLTKMTESFRDVVQQEGRKFGVFLLPIHIQVEGEVENYFPQEQFTKMCRSLRIKCLDLQPELKKEREKVSSSPSWYYDHCHMKSEGNLATAQIVKMWLAGW
jgi:hypothetical protein